ncbi:049L [Invertebrate iridescent virus 6]|uniref:Transmembrane protein 049L n=1 Tax=Invertebrate iridescent virus 6 TaxID=176652 RepID=049L_IIV6|nr:049L [Invertebrate iridescent virus 6]Q91G50.1 RecName: Full=Transmembrane protein 049L [Invertebrate iridescent virus 6]AAK81982.1 049L [Invertebrate iridescent virus 6]QMS79713.1 hypothetical protein IIV6-T1_054 [Invertebrate iridescent virus 6]
MDKIEELKIEELKIEIPQRKTKFFHDSENSDKRDEEETLNPTITSKAKILIKSKNFWIETLIFVISVFGALCVAFGIMLIGFLLWLVSNTISILYFIKQKQYPLSLQQMVFLITTCIGVYNNV